MITFGLICEGITDQIVIENILVGYFNNPDIEVNALQPLRDATDENLATNHANWHKVFEYCKSNRFKEAFQQEELYLIIQIDTDIFFSENVSKEYQITTKDEDGKDLSIEDLVQQVIEKFIENIGEIFYEQYQERIIFAISVHATECWLLPLYFTDKKKEKTVNCLKTLNPSLKKKYNFTIDKKDPEYYRVASKPYQKHKTIKRFRSKNPSLKLFILEVEKRNIEFPVEDW